MIAAGLRLARRVVCLGAHPDDIEIGCGGLLLRLAGRGDVQVDALVLTGEQGRAEEARQALPRFVPGATVEVAGLPDGRLPGHWSAVKETMERFGHRHPADMVLTPRTDDAHQDHRLVSELASTVWRASLVLRYEIPKWDGDFGGPNHYVALDRDTAEHKVRLLNECFPSQAARDWWDDDLFLGLMRLRGMEARVPYAEGFFVTKALLDVG